MQRKYYRYDDMGSLAPKFGAPMHAVPRAQNNTRSSDTSPGGEIITPQPVSDRQEVQRAAKHEKSSIKAKNLLQDGKLLGRFETDDILLLCLIFLLLQNNDEFDWALMAALGYIFLSDKDFKLF